MASGYVKMHREAMDHAVFRDPWLWKLFSWCVMRANFKTTNAGGKVIQRGSFTTGRIQAADELEASPSRVYRGFERLVALGCITIEPNSRWTTVTVCNYSTYQSDDPTERTADEQQMNSQRTAGDTTSGQPADTLKEGKKGRREEGKNIVPNPPLLDELVSAWNAAAGTIAVRKLTDKRLTAARARLSEPDWNWRAALAKFPLRCFSEPGSFIPDFDFFLRPDTVTKILEGKYDWSKSNGNQSGKRPGPGQTYDPSAPADSRF